LLGVVPSSWRKKNTVFSHQKHQRWQHDYNMPQCGMGHMKESIPLASLGIQKGCESTQVSETAISPIAKKGAYHW
jgi:hypothetical protein